MLTEIHILSQMAPRKLDEYLSRGWFRMGQMIFTCHLLCVSDEVYSTVWIRLDLEDYRLKKKLRKISNRNQRFFQTMIRPAIFNQERQDLYEIHKTRFEGYVPGTLQESLFGMEERNIYNTYEIAVYDKDQLIAVSYFDVGADSIASIMALYHPDYSRYSLGIYTMICEVEYAMKEGKRYYYPGYFVPRYEKFDYKLRLGVMEYYDVPKGRWQGLELLEEENLPAETINQRLNEMLVAMVTHQSPAKKLTYPFYDKDLFGYEEEEFLQSPMFIDCSVNHDDDEILFVEYHYTRKIYRLCKGVRTFNSASIFLSSFMSRFDPERSCLDIVQIDKVVIESYSVSAVIDKLLQIA